MSKLKVNEIEPVSGVSIGVGGPSGDPSAILNIQSQTQGLKIPQMTTAQRNSIPAPSVGLIIYNTDSQAIETFNGSGWEPGGIKSINGQTAKAQQLTIGASGNQPNWTQSGSDTNTLNIPLANGSGVDAGLISNEEYLTFNSRLFPTKNIKYVVTNSTLGPQDYNSVSDALASITDAAPTNIYLIHISPGIFVEPQLNLLPYVFVDGTGPASILVAENPNDVFINGADECSLTNVTISGATGENGVAVQYSGGSASSFIVKNCSFADNTQFIKLVGNPNFPTQFTTDECLTSPQVNFTTAISVETVPGDQIAIIYCDGLFINSGTASGSTADFFKISGPSSLATIRSCLLTSNVQAPVANAFRVENGGSLTVLSCDITGMSKAIYAPNTGAAPVLSINGIHTFGCTNDVVIEHTGATGNIAGAIHVATSSVDSDLLNFFSSDPQDGITFTGGISFGDTFNDRTDVTRLLAESPSMGVYSGGILSSGGGFVVNVTSGSGYYANGEALNFLEWNATSITLTANTSNYIYFNTSGILSTSSSFPDTTSNVLLGRVVTNGTSIEFIDQSPFLATYASNRNDNFIRDALGPIFKSGCVVNENATPLKLDVTAGTYYFGNNMFSPAATTATSFDTFYRNGSGGYTIGNTDTVDVNHYDDGSGTLASIPSGNYARHTLYLVGDGANQKFLFVYSQATFSTLVQAENGNIPAPPTFFNDGVVLIASIIVKQGTTSIVAGGGSILDNRPVIGFTAPSATAQLVHGNLLGLNADDHKQYLLVNGSRAMAGSLNMGGNPVTSAGQYNGVTVEAHASRHLPNGSDALTTAAPSSNLNAGTSNATGIANSLSRSDHSHAIDTGAPSTQLPDQTNSAGSSTNLSRADHAHNIPTAAPVTSLSATTTNAQGIGAAFSRNDHTHAILTGTPSGQTPNQANSAGTSANVARADHVHNIPTGVAVGLTAASTNTQGSAASFSQADHTHAIATGTVSTQFPDQTNAAGSSSNLARADHAHNIPTAIAVDIGSANAQGTAAAFARADHVHKGVHCVQANGGTSRSGDINLIAGNDLQIVDNGDNSFTLNVLGQNEDALKISYPGTGLSVNFVAGQVQINGVLYAIAAGSLLLSGSVANGSIYIDIDGTIKSNASVFPPNSVPLATFTTNSSSVTVLTDARTFLHNNVVFGLSSDIAGLTPDSAASAGFTEKYADAGHVHAIATAAASTQTPNQSNAKGSSNSFARADHVHNIPTAAAVGLSATTTNTQGSASSFAQSDHTHALSTGVVSTQTPDQTNAAGTSPNLARADHAHNIPTAAATGLNASSTNTQGVATTFVRSDHTHAIASGAASTQTPDQANGAGISTNFARADHTHNIPTGTPSALSPNTGNSQGAASAFARQDHIHNVPTAAPANQTIAAAAADGTAATFSRADHIHTFSTAAAVSLSTSSANTQGSSTSFARADHTHAVSVTNQQVTAAAGTTSVGTSDTLITGMALTPSAGTYWVVFTSSCVNSANGAQRTFASIYFNGAQQTNSEIAIGSSGGGYAPVTLQSIVTADGVNPIQIRARVAGGTTTWYQMTMQLIKLG